MGRLISNDKEEDYEGIEADKSAEGEQYERWEEPGTAQSVYVRFRCRYVIRLAYEMKDGICHADENCPRSVGLQCEIKQGAGETSGIRSDVVSYMPYFLCSLLTTTENNKYTSM